MTFPHETKNKIVKAYANVCNQRINLAKSLAYKAAMRFNKFLIDHKEGFPKVTRHEGAKLISKPELFSKPWKNLLPCTLDEKISQKIYFCKKIYHKNTRYIKNLFIVDDQNNPQNLLKIVELITINNDYFLICETFLIEKFNQHLRSFKVGKNLQKYSVVTCDINLNSLPFNLNKICDGLYFRIKHV